MGKGGWRYRKERRALKKQAEAILAGPQSTEKQKARAEGTLRRISREKAKERAQAAIRRTEEAQAAQEARRAQEEAAQARARREQQEAEEQARLAAEGAEQARRDEEAKTLASRKAELVEAIFQKLEVSVLWSAEETGKIRTRLLEEQPEMLLTILDAVKPHYSLADLEYTIRYLAGPSAAERKRREKAQKEFWETLKLSVAPPPQPPSRRNPSRPEIDLFAAQRFAKEEAARQKERAKKLKDPDLRNASLKEQRELLGL